MPCRPRKAKTQAWVLAISAVSPGIAERLLGYHEKNGVGLSALKRDIFHFS
jgi:hypothetical protein